MAKGKNSVFFCQSCGYESTKWMGQCPACKEWNTMVEEVVDKKTTVTHKQITELQVSKLNDVQSSSEERLDTHIKELNRVLGGGITCWCRSWDWKVNITITDMSKPIGSAHIGVVHIGRRIFTADKNAGRSYWNIFR